jgi:hypothetical protein
MSFRRLFFRSTSPRRKPRHGNSYTTGRTLAERLLIVETLERRSLLAGNPVVTGFALAAGSDSGISPYAETFADRVTNVTSPTLTGTAPQDSSVSIYADTDGNGTLDVGTDVLLGTVIVPASGTWSLTTPTSLNDPLISATTDGARTLFAQDSADDTSSYAQLDIFLDTVGPRVANVTFIPTGQETFQRVPTSPNTSITGLDITFTDSPLRTAEFQSFSALNYTLANIKSNYQLTGDKGGSISISSVNYSNATQVNGPGTTEIVLTFANPLPDDTYTLTILDNLQSDPGNALDGETVVTAGSSSTIAAADGTQGVLSGDGAPGGTFSAKFGVQGGLDMAVQMTQGIQYTDLAGPVAGASAIASPFYKASDVVFAGNFADPSSGIADGFSKLAAYGIDGGKYRFLFKSDTDGTVRSGVSPVQFAGFPVAGNFDGNSFNGDEVGLFCGTTWYLLSSDLTSVIKTVNWPVQGLPAVGDFDGDTIPDLATWSNGNFYVAFGANTYSEIDSVVPLIFSGTTARPVAADIDGDSVSDLGLWLPNSGVPSTSKPADWYFLPSGGVSLMGRTTPFTPVHYQFGSSVGVPLTGIFSPSTMPGLVTPSAVSTSASTSQLILAANATAASPTSLKVSGTTGNDVVQLTAGKSPGTWILNVNGKSQAIGSSVTTLNLNGLGGSNQLTILGRGKNETAEIWSDHASFRSGSLTVTAANFTNTTINGGNNSTDTVRYHDTAGNAWFVAVPNASSLTGANYLALGLNFAKTVVVSPVGKSGNIANFYPATTLPAISNSASSAVVSFADKGILAESAFFGKVQIHSRSGAVTKTIVPTISWTTPAQVFSATTLSPATSVNLNLAAASLTQAQKKVSGLPAPSTVDSVMASYGS